MGLRMADARRKHPQDRGGGWFVDASCMDCDLARQVGAPIEADAHGLSYFARPPHGPEEERAAWRALLGCPTGSIGAPPGAKPPPDVYPWEVAPGAFLAGYNARHSFGASSWFVPRPEGNLLVDAPRFVPALVDAFEARGGLAHVLLTHRDDVADWDRYAERFGATAWIHEADADAAPGARTLAGDATLAPGVRAIWTPGHTRGSMMFLVDDRLLFTGDSLHWSREEDDLAAFPDFNWYSWPEQIRSLERMARERFEWVLPGHGMRGHAPAEDMRSRLLALVERARASTVSGAW